MEVDRRRRHCRRIDDPPLFVRSSGIRGGDGNGSIASDIRLRVNGAEWQATDADGNVIYPIVIDGVSYLPVRSMALALNTEIGWDAETRTIRIGGASQPAYRYNGEEFKDDGQKGNPQQPGGKPGMRR